MAVILLEGRPGVGKTTVIRRCVDELLRASVPVRGFTTSEIRVEGRRVGFRVEAVGGASAVLAHVEFPGPPRVGRYGVDVEAFERVALPSLEGEDPGVLVVDEIGKMELASARFRRRIAGPFGARAEVLATVHRHRHPFTDRLKAHPDARVVRVTDLNRDGLPPMLLAAWIGPF